MNFHSWMAGSSFSVPSSDVTYVWYTCSARSLMAGEAAVAFFLGIRNSHFMSETPADLRFHPQGSSASLRHACLRPLTLTTCQCPTPNWDFTLLP